MFGSWLRPSKGVLVQAISGSSQRRAYSGITNNSSIINLRANILGQRLEAVGHQQFAVTNSARNKVIIGESANCDKQNYKLLAHKVLSPHGWSEASASLKHRANLTSSVGLGLFRTSCGASFNNNHQSIREFHAAGSKVNYLDFRYRFRTNHLRLHLLIVRRQKMKKHKLRKFRKKFKCLLAKQRLKREIAKEKTFRVELLTMIRRAESFDPREYALKKISEVNNKPKALTREERLEELKDLIRVNRYQVTYIKPKHRRADI